MAGVHGGGEAAVSDCAAPSAQGPAHHRLHCVRRGHTPPVHTPPGTAFTLLVKRRVKICEHAERRSMSVSEASSGFIEIQSDKICTVYCTESLSTRFEALTGFARRHPVHTSASFPRQHQTFLKRTEPATRRRARPGRRRAAFCMSRTITGNREPFRWSYPSQFSANAPSILD